MSMGSEISTTAMPPASSRFSLPRFPVRWAVESDAAERHFARLLWLLVPLQYYVVTNLGHGLSANDLIPAVSLTLITVLVIFFVSCAAAVLASAVYPLDPAQGDTMTGRVRMWVVALMMCTAAGYFLLALSLAAAHIAINRNVTIYGDLVTDRLTWLMRAFGLSQQAVDALSLYLLALANLIYAFAALLMIVLLHRALRRGPPGSALRQEPDAISAGLIVAIVMTVANYAATMD